MHRQADKYLCRGKVLLQQLQVVRIQQALLLLLLWLLLLLHERHTLRCCELLLLLCGSAAAHACIKRDGARTTATMRREGDRRVFVLLALLVTS